jgi:hypothetical protein
MNGCLPLNLTVARTEGNGRYGARLWENTWDEAADAVFRGKTIGMPDRSTDDACGLNEAITS